MKKFMRLLAVSALAISSSFAGTIVGVELQFLVDVSGSVDNSEYLLQRDGIADAISSAAVKTSIANWVAAGKNGIAVQYVQWSGAGQQSITVDWTLLTSATDADNFAAAIKGGARAYSGATAIQDAMVFGATQFLNNYDGLYKISDVSGDGSCNSGACGVVGKTAMTAGGIKGQRSRDPQRRSGPGCVLHQ